MQSLAFMKDWRERSRKWQPQIPAPVAIPGGDRMQDALSAGEPIATLVPPSVPPSLFVQVLSDAAALLAQHQSGARPTVDQLAAALAALGEVPREQLAQTALYSEDLAPWAEANNVDAGLLAALTGLALQPFLAAYAKAVSADAPIALWRQNYCPVCGRTPDVCRIDPDNLRWLHCPQCDTQWQHYRLTCAVCDTDDVKKVQILTLQDLEPWRVEVCDNCGGYIKTLDQRHGGALAMPHVDLFVEDARTLQLDLLAQQEGYGRGGRVQ